MPSTITVILVVEDDPRIRSLAEYALQGRYERVVLASGAEEAQRLFDSDPEIGLVFTDVTLPGGPDGIKMVARMREKNPNIPVLVTTGDPGFVPPHLSRCRFLPKPYDKAALFAALDALDGMQH